MERLEQGHLHPLPEQPENQTRASKVGSEHSSKELFEQLVNGGISTWARYMTPPVHMLHEHTRTHMNCTSTVCRPSSTCKLLNPEYWHQHLQFRMFNVREDRSRRGHHYGKTWLTKATRDWHVLTRNRTWASGVGSELFKQLGKSYSEHLYEHTWTALECRPK